MAPCLQPGVNAGEGGGWSLELETLPPPGTPLQPQRCPFADLGAKVTHSNQMHGFHLNPNLFEEAAVRDVDLNTSKDVPSTDEVEK